MCEALKLYINHTIYSPYSRVSCV